MLNCLAHHSHQRGIFDMLSLQSLTFFLPVSLWWKDQFSQPTWPAPRCPVPLFQKVHMGAERLKYDLPHFSPSDPTPVPAEKVSDRSKSLPHLLTISFHHPIPDQEKNGYQGDDQQPNSPMEVHNTCRYHHGNKAWNKYRINVSYILAWPSDYWHVNEMFLFRLLHYLFCIYQRDMRECSWCENGVHRWHIFQQANAT